MDEALSTLSISLVAAGGPEITDTSGNLVEMGLDSLGFMMLLILLQQAGYAVSMDDLYGPATIGGVVERMRSLKSHGAI